MKHKNTLSEQNAELLYDKAGGTYKTTDWALRA
jgi:hypothetical protein